MAIKLLKEFFGIRHLRKHFYEALPQIVAPKDKVESKVLAVAKKEFNFFHKPQILIGLIINTDGFPVAYEIFEGNKFEGHTIIPIITAFQRKHKIKTLTVVADAAMLSLANMQALEKNGLHYIIGARIKNLPNGLAKRISARPGQGAQLFRNAFSQRDKTLEVCEEC